MPNSPSWISLKTWEKLRLIIEAIIIADTQMSFHVVWLSILAAFPYGFFLIFLNGISSLTIERWGNWCPERLGAPVCGCYNAWRETPTSSHRQEPRPGASLWIYYSMVTRFSRDSRSIWKSSFQSITWDHLQWNSPGCLLGWQMGWTRFSVFRDLVSGTRTRKCALLQSSPGELGWVFCGY